MNVTVRRETRALLSRAFVDSLPVLMGYTSMGFVAGVFLATKGLLAWPVLWAFLLSFCWVSGAMVFAVVPEIAAQTPILPLMMLMAAVNFRYAFYGFSMLERWRGAPRLQKAYLIGMLTDENYALECAAAVGEPKLYLRYCTFLSLFNHFYWVVGVTVGALVVCLLGKAVDPVTIRRWTNGMEFSMAALFLVIFTDQMKGVFFRGK